MGVTAKFEISQTSEDADKITKSHDTPVDRHEKTDAVQTPTSSSTKNEEPQPPDPPKAHITFEDILEKLGCFGPFQVLTLVTYLFMEIASAFVVFIPIFVGRSTIPANCTDSGEYENETMAATTEAGLIDYSFEGDGYRINQTNQSQIEITESSLPSIVSISAKSFVDSFYEILEFKHETFVDEWDLKCDKAWVVDIFTSCLMAGMIFGNLVSCQICDWYGRRKTLLIVLIFMAIGTILSAMSPSIYFYAFARFVSGAAYCGYISVSAMAVMEFMTPKWRSVANCVGPIGEGIMLLSLIAYFVRPWRMLYLATLAPYIFIVPIFMYLPESPRWLLRNKKMKEAHHVLGYMAKINRREPISMDVLEALRRQEELASASLKQKRISYIDFLKNRKLFKTSLYLFAIWFSWNVAYYGISYNIRNVPGNPYINGALVGFGNAVGQRGSFIICDWFGRRRAVLASMSFSSSFLVALAVCFLALDSVNKYLILVGCFCGIIGMSSCRACLRLLSGESFPTSVRTMGLGVGGLGGNIAGLLTPQLTFLGTIWPSLPFFVFAGIAVTGSLVVFMMEETNGNPLSDEVQISVKKKKQVKGDV